MSYNAENTDHARVPSPPDTPGPGRNPPGLTAVLSRPSPSRRGTWTT